MFTKARSERSCPGGARVDFKNHKDGTEYSLYNGCVITSTGINSLDNIIGLGGLNSQSILLVEENSTTDFSGNMCRAFSSYGLAKNHYLWIAHPEAEQWLAMLPLITFQETTIEDKDVKQEMKIAWRYAELDKHKTSLRKTHFRYNFTQNLPLSKHFSRISIFNDFKYDSLENLLDAMISDLKNCKSHLPNGSILRIVIPSFLSPGYYPSATHSSQINKGIYKLIRELKEVVFDTEKYPLQAVSMITLSTYVHSHNNNYLCWFEKMSDCVLELKPFKHSDETKNSQNIQGLLFIRKYLLPVPYNHHIYNLEAQDFAFKQSRKDFVVEPWILPPIDGDNEIRNQLDSNSMLDF